VILRTPFQLGNAVSRRVPDLQEAVPTGREPGVIGQIWDLAKFTW